MGLGLLSASLKAVGVSVRTRYFAIDFAERLGESLYSSIFSGEAPPHDRLAGEWLFSRSLFGETSGDDDAYVEEVLGGARGYRGGRVPSRLVARLLVARRHVEPFLDSCLDEVLAASPTVVGFTSLFQQHVASLALAKRLKRSRPETLIVLGGANCEGVMGAETVRQFSFVDAAVSGEGDRVFPELVQRVLAHRPIEDLPGVLTRATVDSHFRQGTFANAPQVTDLDELPYPDLDDYFAQFARSRLGRDWQPSVPFETSRGCWWGERMHCTFCGLNGADMAFRSKSPARAVEEFEWLTTRYAGCDVNAVDNIIDTSYFETVLPKLGHRPPRVEVFYETKANLTRDQISRLRDAGVTTIQPGIESLSDAALKLMRKGVTGLQNVQLLKWCLELGVTPRWNWLWGFPGEEPEEYASMAQLVPLLSHLPPPDDCGTIRLDRFSPNFFDADSLGFVDVRPWVPYGHVYPLSESALRNLAYYFSFGYREPRDVDGYVRPLEEAIRAWQLSHHRNALLALDVDERLFIWDLRWARGRPPTILNGLERLLYVSCDRVSTLNQLVERATECGYDASASDVERRLHRFVSMGLMLRRGRRYLSLTLWLASYRPPLPVRARLRRAARATRSAAVADGLASALGGGPLQASHVGG